MVSEWSKERCVVLGEYLVEHGATVRSAAQVFGVSKSTVHKDVTVVLKNVNRALYLQVFELLQKKQAGETLARRGGDAPEI